MAIIQQKTNNSHVMLFDKEHFPKLSPKMFTGQFWQSQNAVTGQAEGRGITYFFKHNKKEYVLRHYRRGGLIGKILDDQYLFTGLEQSRPWQEFRLLQHMQTLDLPCPTPIAAILTKNGLSYRADIISTKIPKAQDLHHILLNTQLSADVWKKIGRTIAEFHNNQICHHDLNIHNIMLDESYETYLIDFDKCEVKQGDKWKTANMNRLKRSFEKEQSLSNIRWKTTDWEMLISAYTQTTSR